jgi:hypothetical protein
MATIVLNAHLELSLTILLKNVYMFADKILLMMQQLKNVFVLLDTELPVKFALNAHQTILFKTIIALLAQ